MPKPDTAPARSATRPPRENSLAGWPGGERAGAELRASEMNSSSFVSKEQSLLWRFGDAAVCGPAEVEIRRSAALPKMRYGL